MRRALFTVLTAASLVLCATTVAAMGTGGFRRAGLLWIESGSEPGGRGDGWAVRGVALDGASAVVGRGGEWQKHYWAGFPGDPPVPPVTMTAKWHVGPGAWEWWPNVAALARVRGGSSFAADSDEMVLHGTTYSRGMLRVPLWSVAAVASVLPAVWAAGRWCRRARRRPGGFPVGVAVPEPDREGAGA